MSFKNLFLFFFCYFFLFFHRADAFNITQQLSHYPGYSTFNDYLTKTGLAQSINSRQTITVFVVHNNNMASVTQKPMQVIHDILSAHVVLDYYDMAKLQKLPNKTEKLTTLFQASGKAVGQQGFLNATDTESGSVSIAPQGSSQSASVVKSVFQELYNISVLQVSNVIMPSGIENPSNSSPPAPAPGPAPAPKPKAKAPSSAPSPSKFRKGSPVVSPPAPTADTPTADTPTADEPATPGKEPDAGTNLRLNGGAVFMVVSSALFSLVAMI